MEERELRRKNGNIKGEKEEARDKVIIIGLRDEETGKKGGREGNG